MRKSGSKVPSWHVGFAHFKEKIFLCNPSMLYGSRFTFVLVSTGFVTNGLACGSSMAFSQPKKRLETITKTSSICRFISNKSAVQWCSGQNSRCTILKVQNICNCRNDVDALSLYTCNYFALANHAWRTCH